MSLRLRIAVWLLHGAHKLVPPRTTSDGHRMFPIPVPPFDSPSDEKTALGAALIHVTHLVTGQWPSADAVSTALEALARDE